MPAPIIFAHKLAKRLTDVRKDGTLPYLRPDGKTQVTVEYDEEGRIIRIDTVLISTQHDPAATLEQIRADLLKHVITPVLPADLCRRQNQVFRQSDGQIRHRRPSWRCRSDGRKSSSTPTAVMRVTAEAHFPAKILQRLTVLPLMQRDTWRKISSRQVSRINAKSRSHMR